MKRENISAYFKGKNFYVSLLVGVCAVIAITAVYVGVTSNKKDNLVDLNEPLTEVAKEEKVIKEEIATTGELPKTELADSTATVGNDSLLENDVVTDENALKETMSDAVAEENKEEKKDVVNTDTIPAMNPSGVPNIKFNEEKGLLWPIKDNPNVIMDYSMDKGIYFETLMQYKTNPAIIIAADVGTEILSAADGIVTEISKDEETGLTLTMAIGNDYSIVYGQIQDSTLDVGDTIKEGDIIGKVAEPTKYYIVEGSNLYFKVLEKEETVDPMLLLR